MRTFLGPACIVAGVVAASAVLAQGAPEQASVTLTLDHHRFTPADIVVPANQKVAIVLVNKDSALEEFDSDDLGVEQRVTPGATIRFDIGPLKPGVYRFMGELHPGTAQGTVTVQ